MTAETTTSHSPDGLVQISDESGRQLDPSTLMFAARELEPGELASIATLARSSGLVLERDGLSILALGAAARIVAPNGFSSATATMLVTAALNALERHALEPHALEPHALEPHGASDDSRRADTPLVIGSLPFDSFSPAELTIPVVTARVNEDSAVLICVAKADQIEALMAEPTSIVAKPVAAAPPPDHFELTSVQPHEEFKALVGDAVRAIASGEFQKVVVAREVEVRANRPFAPADLLGRLRALYPSCATFSMNNFVGASPELLCRRQGSRASAHPLAGTVARSGDPEEDERLAKRLFASPKERSEHGIVVTAIVDALDSFSSEVTFSPEPHLLELRNVVHLATTIEAQLNDPLPGALELALALHPTPAVGGFPTAAALKWLEANETLQRDRYAGPVGFMDATGDGEWWLGIRSALLSGSTARLIAGVGIVADSDPAAELAETQLKLQALLAAAVRP